MPTEHILQFLPAKPNGQIGDIVGTTVGCRDDGTIVGSVVGTTLGINELGNPVGVPVGNTLGAHDGTALGKKLGG